MAVVTSREEYWGLGFPGGAAVKNLPANEGDARDVGAPWETQGDPSVRRILWRRKWQPNPVFLPGKFHGQRSQVGYSPWGHKESDSTEPLIHLSDEKQTYSSQNALLYCLNFISHVSITVSNIRKN